MAMIDLNADLGETINGVPTANDEAMFALISSASIACGGHAGDAASMRTAVERADRYGVVIGAHPAYPDRAGFGRVAIDLAAEQLRAEVSAQLSALQTAGADIRYVKPHGALYHRAGSHAATADALVACVLELSARIGRALPILGLGATLAASARAHGLPFMREAFLDRGYLPSGDLVPRDGVGALLDDPAQVAARAVELVRHGRVAARDGSLLISDAASLCLHGDTPAALEMARSVRAALAAERIDVVAPW